MTWTMSSGLSSNFTKIAAVVLLAALPATSVVVPANAAPDAPAVIPAPLPADPPQPAPPPPPPGQPTHGEYYNPGDQDDWWVYSGTGSF